MFCESPTGYLFNFIVYTGADTAYPNPGLNFPKSFDDYSNPQKVVLSLMKNLYNQGYTMVSDNLYTSPELFPALYYYNTDCFETLTEKKGLPKDVWSWKPSKGCLIEPI